MVLHGDSGGGCEASFIFPVNADEGGSAQKLFAGRNLLELRDFLKLSKP
jgi:hypothetical protein